MELIIKQFRELTAAELYAIYRLRTAVFVVEQKCPYQEVDEWDPLAWHFWLRDDTGEIAAYLRLIPWERTGEGVIGRVVSAWRRMGLGSRLLGEAVAFARNRLRLEVLTLAAQTYAQAFYERAGFSPVSEVFLEDGIPHIQMTLCIK